VRDIEFAYKHLDPKLQADPEIAFEAFRMKNEGLNDWPLPDVLRNDRAFVTRLAKANIWAYESLGSRQFNDPALKAEVAMGFPPVLDRATPEEREALFQVRPELRQRYETVKQQLAELGIEDPMRLRSAQLLNEVLNNRFAPRAKDDTRPTAILAYARAATDEHRAFDRNNLEDLCKNYRVMYYEVGSDRDVVDALKDGSKAGSAALVVIGGHGNTHDVNLGGVSTSYANYSPRDEALELDLGTRAS
jgi:hypothetical protein